MLFAKVLCRISIYRVNLFFWQHLRGYILKLPLPHSQNQHVIHPRHMRDKRNKEKQFKNTPTYNKLFHKER